MDLFDKKKQTEVNNISPLQSDQEAKSKLYAQPEAIPEPPATPAAPIAPANPMNPAPQNMTPPIAPVAPANPVAPAAPINPINPVPQNIVPPPSVGPATPVNSMPPAGTEAPTSNFSGLRETLREGSANPKIGMAMGMVKPSAPQSPGLASANQAMIKLSNRNPRTAPKIMKNFKKVKK